MRAFCLNPVVLGLAVALAVPWGGPVWAKDEFRLSTGMIEPWTNAEGSGFHQVLVREVFSRLGLTATVELNLASSRAFNLANDGITDGLAGRVAGMEKEYPNLVAVPERMFVNDFVACALPGTEPPKDWKGLVDRGVAHIIGWQIFENNLPPVRELTTVKDSAQLLGLLRAGRIEIILHERWQAMWHARALGVTLVCSDQPLARTAMYIYLNNRHAAQVEPLARALRSMKADGGYDAVARTVFGGLGGSTTGLK